MDFLPVPAVSPILPVLLSQRAETQNWLALKQQHTTKTPVDIVQIFPRCQSLPAQQKSHTKWSNKGWPVEKNKSKLIKSPQILWHLNSGKIKGPSIFRP